MNKDIFRGLVIGIVCICLTQFAYAEDKPIKFTETQKKTLEGMVIAFQVAQGRVTDFVNYLSAEYKVDQSYMVSKDMSGFEKAQPKVELPQAQQRPAPVAPTK